MTSTKDEDPIIAFKTVQPFHEPAVLCLEHGCGFDKPLKRSEVTQKRCDWCGKYAGTLEETYEMVARRRPQSMTSEEAKLAGLGSPFYPREPMYQDEGV